MKAAARIRVRAQAVTGLWRQNTKTTRAEGRVSRGKSPSLDTHHSTLFVLFEPVKWFGVSISNWESIVFDVVFLPGKTFLSRFYRISQGIIILTQSHLRPE